MTALKNILTTTAIAGTLMVSQAFAADYGLTVAIGDSNQIRVPIKLTDYVIEPYVAYQKESRQEISSDTDTQVTSLGLGVFRVLSLAEQVEAHVGVKGGYTSSEVEYGYHGSNGTDLYKQNWDGYTIAPSASVFYSFNPKFQLGVEVNYNYTNLTGEYQSQEHYYSGNVVETSTDGERSISTELQSFVVARIYF